MATLQDLAIRVLIRQESVKKDLKKVKASFDKAWDGIKKSAAAAGVAAGAAMTAGLLGALDVREAQAKLAASLDNAEVARQAGRIAGDLYARGFGESSSEVVAAAGAVHSSLERVLDGTDAMLSNVTRKALAFAKVFDVDVGEAARNAGVLIETGLARNADEAFDLIVAAMQRVPAHLRAEIIDATEEYSQFLAQVGFTGAEAFGVLTSSARYAGKYGIDKAGDAIKEFTIRATDMSALTVSAFETIGLDAQKMAERLLAGGDTSRGAFQEIVSGLRGIQDPVLQSNTAIALFGTMLEDLGTGNIPDFLASLDPAVSSLGDVAGAADEMTSTLEDGQSPLKEFRRQVQSALVKQMEKAIPFLRGVAKWLKDHKAIIVPLVAVLGAFAAIVGTIIAITKVWTAVQTALNIVLAMNPIGLVVLAVGALIAVIAILWENSAAFRDFWVGIWDKIQEAAAAVGRWFRDTLYGKWIKGAWDAIVGAGETVVGWFKSLPGKIKAAFVGIVKIVANPFITAFNGISGAWNNTVGRLSWTVPDWVPFIGGKTVAAPKLPKIPLFHDGGIIPGRGDQIIKAEGGEGVFTREQMKALGQRGGQTFVFQADGRRASQLLLQLFSESIKGQGLQVVTR